MFQICSSIIWAMSSSYIHRPQFLYLVHLLVSDSNAVKDMIVLMLPHSWFILLLIGVCCANWLSQVWYRCHILSSRRRCTLKVCLGHWHSMGHTTLHLPGILIFEMRRTPYHTSTPYPLKTLVSSTKFHSFSLTKTWSVIDWDP